LLAQEEWLDLGPPPVNQDLLTTWILGAFQIEPAVILGLYKQYDILLRNNFNPMV
jgi:hypothetical protein